GDDFFGAGGFAEPALHAEAFGETQHRAIGVIGQRAGWAGGDAGMAQRAAVDVKVYGAEGRARRQRYDIDGRGGSEVKLAKRCFEHAAFRAPWHEAGGL